jgi:DNA-binding winged helix-turn-helix (wHTH) protein/tetratricopeptide (TPR) repeat protein
MSRVVYLFDEFRFLPATRELLRAGVRVELPRRTFECLEHLIAQRDRAVDRDELVEAVFGRSNVSDAQLGQVILRARRAVDDDGNTQRVIRTIAGYGYRWVADVRSVIESEAQPLAEADESAVVASVPADSAVSASAATDAPTTAMQTLAASLPRRRWTSVIAAVALASVALSIALIVRRAHAPASTDGTASTSPASAVVLPIQVDALRDDAWIRLGAMDLIADRLRQAGFGVPTSENVLALLQTTPNASAESDPTTLRSATGARLIVRGKVTRRASGWQVELAAQPEQGIAVPVRFAASDAVQATRGAADLLLAALGRTAPSDGEHDISLDQTLQRARAAMLANELDTARAILTASPQLAASSGELGYRLAQVDLRAGQLDRSESSLTAVLGLAQTRHDVRFHAQVLNARGATRMQRGAFTESGRDFDAAIALLQPDGDALELGQALIGRANSRIPEHRFDEALADFASARTHLESAGDALGVTRVDANLGMLELYRGRPAAALGYLSGAADRFQSFGALHELLINLSGMVDAQMSMLQRDAAWASIERAWALRERITDPDQRVDVLLNRAQVLTGNGRYAEAAAALTQAQSGATSGNRVLLARLRALGADLAWRQGNWSAAAKASKAALADWPSSGADAERSSVVLLRQRSLLELGDDAAAQDLLDRTREAPERATDEPGVVADAIAMAEWLQHAGDTARARRWFRFAMTSADRRGVPAEIVAVAEAYAPILLAADEHEQAVAVIGRVAPWASRDFDCALLQLRLFHQLDSREAWFNALQQAQSLAGERVIPTELATPRSIRLDRSLRLSEEAH